MEKTVEKQVRVCDVCEQIECSDQCLSCGRDICIEDNWGRTTELRVKGAGMFGILGCSVDLCIACGPSMKLEDLEALLTVGKVNNEH